MEASSFKAGMIADIRAPFLMAVSLVEEPVYSVSAWSAVSSLLLAKGAEMTDRPAQEVRAHPPEIVNGSDTNAHSKE